MDIETRAWNIETVVVADNNVSDVQDLWKKTWSARKKDHCLYWNAGNSRKKWIVTDCDSEIVTKALTFRLGLAVPALWI